MQYERLFLDILTQHQATLLDEWVETLQSSSRFRDSLMGSERARAHCTRLLEGLKEALQTADSLDLNNPSWAPLREQLREGAEELAQEGFRPSEAAAVVLLFRKPLNEQVARSVEGPGRIAEAIEGTSALLDQISLWKIEFFYESQQQIIRRQQQELLELSTPVVELWQGVLALPLIGTIDSNRAQVVMESLLNRIVETEAEVAIIDITGVPTVDTMVAQHLLKAVAATRLMGAHCIISGISPTIAQTMVQLGIDLESVTTKATIAAALEVAMRTRGVHVVQKATGASVASRTSPNERSK